MDEILRDFVVETSENIDLVDAELVRFEQEPNNSAIVGQIFRLVHTVKGTCGFLGLPRLEALAHAAETVIGRLRDGVPVTRDVVSLILETIDRIKLIVNAIDQTEREPEGGDADLIAQLEAAAIAAPSAASETPQFPSGSLVYQVLERPLRPDEVPLDELEKAFRDAPGPKKPANSAPETVSGMVSGIDLKRNTIRVAVDTLEHMMTMVSELVLTRNQLMEIARRSSTPEFNVSLQRLSQVTGELQDGVMKTRMQPVGHAWSTLPRLVRDLCADLGKEIDLEAEGANTEIDRQVLELIKDPITHMIRNASDHGIERPEERIAAGKSRRGKIRLSATQEGGYIKLLISDDGRGLDIDRIRIKAVAQGLASDTDIERMSDNQAAKFIFHPGFSTASTVSSISGRGVGMDVVRANIEQAGGSIDLRSEYGKGTTFIIRIPLTLAIAAALIVTCADQRFAIPQIAVVEVVKPRAGSDARIEKLNDACVLRLREKLLPVASLKSLLKLADDADLAEFDNKFIVICQFENNLYGLAVDAVLQTEEIVIKPVSMRLRNIPVYSGTTILGDGSVIMIVDPNGVGGIIGTLSDGDIRHSGLGNRTLADATETRTSLLVFRAGSDSFKAVPLGLVTRLEEVPVEKIESAAAGYMLQYRGRLMPLVPANADVVLRESGSQPILVFSRGARAAGMIVDEIVDIVQDKLEIEQASPKSGSIGSAIVRGRATDIVDVAAILPFIGAAEQKRQFQHPDGPGTILLADDSDFFRALLGPVLKAAGFRVHLVETGDEALKFLLNHRCDALVTDLDMPGVSGFDVAARLRADPAYKSLKIIGLSERGGAATVSRGRQIGFDDIVGKFDRQGLVASLMDLIASEEKAA